MSPAVRLLGVLALICMLGTAPAQATTTDTPKTTDKPKEIVRVGSMMIEPFLMNDPDGGQRGFIPDLLDNLAGRMGVDFHLIVSDDNDFGARNDNGTWSGLIGDVLAGDIDMAAAALTQTSMRADDVDFSTPFMNFGSVVIMKKQESVYMTLGDRLERLFSPLARDVWLTAGLAWLVTSAVLYVILHVNPYEWRRLCRDQQATMREGEMANCTNVFWFTISTLLLQGYTRAPRSLGGRCVVTFWWIFVIIFIIMYIASMTNYLRVGPMQDGMNPYSNIRSVQDLANQEKIDFGVLKSGSSSAFLQNAKDYEHRQMWRKLVETDNFVTTVEEGMERVRNDEGKPFAFITETAMAQFYAKQSPCDIYMVGDMAYSGSYSLALAKNSPNLDQLNVELLAMRESGALKTITDKWFRGVCSNYLMEPTQADKVQTPPFYKVDLGSFSGALIILICGILLGGLGTLVEVCVHRTTEAMEEEDLPSGIFGWTPPDCSRLKRSEWMRTD